MKRTLAVLLAVLMIFGCRPYRMQQKASLDRGGRQPNNFGR